MAETGARKSSESDPSFQVGDTLSPILTLVSNHLDANPSRADVVHDFLAHLAREMTTLHEERQRLEKALDPFKFLDHSVQFAALPDVFEDAIKYGERITEPMDLGTVHHDIDGLRLVPEKEHSWMLEVQLKMRDRKSDWQNWQKDGHEIIRERHIIFTDKLIDQIVYRLYGLSEDEIAIVEQD